MAARIVILAMVLSLSTAAALAEKPNLPAPPDGFAWQWCEEARIGVLAPQTWHFKSEKKNATQAHFTSKEPVLPDRQFETGLTVNVVPDIAKNSGAKPSDYAASFVKEATRETGNVLKVLAPQNAALRKLMAVGARKKGPWYISSWLRMTLATSCICSSSRAPKRDGKPACRSGN